MIWQRNEMASTRCPSRSMILTRKLRIGISVSGSAPAETPSTSRSGMSPRLDACRAAKVGEKGVDPLPHLLAAAETAPADADETDELEAAVDRRDVVITRAADAVDEQRLHLRLQLPQHRVVVHHLVPAL